MPKSPYQRRFDERAEQALAVWAAPTKIDAASVNRRC